MKIGLNPALNNHSSGKINFSSETNKDMAFLLVELPDDTFERGFVQNCEEDDILAGPLGHPYTGRPVSSDSKTYEENMSLLEWILNPERELYKRPKTFIGKLFSLGDNNFDDEVSKYHAQAIESAKGFIGKDGPVSIPIGDLNGDGIVDKIVSGINKAIDMDGDGKADIVGTLIDVTGDGKADFIRDSLGNLIEVNGDIAKVVGDSGLKPEDLKIIPEIISSLLDR